MKKSEMYKTAQLAVMNYSTIGGFAKLEILRELMNREDMAKFTEEQDAKENGHAAV